VTEPKAEPKIEDRLLEALVRTAAALCTGDDGLLRAAFNRALDSGATPAMLREVVHTSYLFDGYPTALEGFRILSEIAGVPKTQTQDFSYTSANVELWRERGAMLCRTIYGPQFERLISHVAQFAPELSDAMLVEGYGKVLSREHLNPLVRELCVVAILAAKNRPRQLLSHSLGALRLGAEPDQLRSIVAWIADLVPTANLTHAGETISEALAKSVVP